MNIFLLTKFSINKEEVWLLVSQAVRFSQQPWPGAVPPASTPYIPSWDLRLHRRCASSLSIFPKMKLRSVPSLIPLVPTLSTTLIFSILKIHQHLQTCPHLMLDTSKERHVCSAWNFSKCVWGRKKNCVSSRLYR